jgi:hypothetical protein
MIPRPALLGDFKTSTFGHSSDAGAFAFLSKPPFRRFVLDLSQRTDIIRHGPFGPGVHAITHSLGLMKRSSAYITESREVREHVRSAIVRDDEPATF